MKDRKAIWLIAPGILLAVTATLHRSAPVSAEPALEDPNRAVGTRPAKKESTIEEKSRVPLAVARDRAKVMQDIYAVTLEVIHRRYFHGDRATIPARAMEDVFSEMKRQSDVEARWISVNLKAMSLDHEPKTDFELKAAREIGSGKPEFELVEDGFYRHASAIRLGSGCIGCHAGFFREQDKTPKYSALVISIPLSRE